MRKQLSMAMLHLSRQPLWPSIWQRTFLQTFPIPSGRNPAPITIFVCVLQTPTTRTWRLKQRVRIRLNADIDGTPAAVQGWCDAEGESYIFPTLASYVWGAIIRMRPYPLWCDGTDTLQRGVASCRWRLCSAIPVASTTPSSTLNEAALVRYLAEAVWYPFVLVPGRYGVTWTPGDTPSEATATMVTPEGVRATCTFEFDQHADIVGVRTIRGMMQSGSTFSMVCTATNKNFTVFLMVTAFHHHTASVEWAILELCDVQLRHPRPVVWRGVVGASRGACNLLFAASDRDGTLLSGPLNKVTRKLHSKLPTNFVRRGV